MLLFNYPHSSEIILHSMAKEYAYCDNPEASVPKMFIDKEIGGKDADGFPNIQGNDFLKELMRMSDVDNKGRIEVWINSPGGVVTDGQSIYASILTSRASVDTVCYGIAASIAGVIFQAGKKRKMLSNAHLMYHPAYSEDGRVDKGLEALNNSICTMIAKRTGKTEDEIWAIMNRGRSDDKGTWISAQEALANGFCDEIIDIAALNKNSIEGATTEAVWKSANLVLNRVKTETKNIKMKQVLNKLGLVEDANEASALAAIDALNKSYSEMKEAYDKKKEELAAMKKEMDEMKKKNAEEEAARAKAKQDEEEAKAKAEAEAKNKNSEEFVKKLVADGKIKNEAETIKKWKDAYVKDTKGTEDIAESIPASKKSPEFVPETGDIKDSEAEQAARKAGLKPGTAAWYNAIKSYEITTKK